MEKTAKQTMYESGIKILIGVINSYLARRMIELGSNQDIKDTLKAANLFANMLGGKSPFTQQEGMTDDEVKFIHDMIEIINYLGEEKEQSEDK